MSEGGRASGVTAVLLTANRPDLAIRQIEATAEHFEQLIVADGGSSAGQLRKDEVAAASKSPETTYIALTSWIERIRAAAKQVLCDLVLLMPDDDVLDVLNMQAFADRMSKSPGTSIAGGPWLTGEEAVKPQRRDFECASTTADDSSAWDYRPWLFYGMFRASVFQIIGDDVIPATNQLASRLRLRSSVSRHRLIELSVVLSGQVSGATCVGEAGMWSRSTSRTWRERLVLWEGYLELEGAVMEPRNRGAISDWSGQLEDALHLTDQSVSSGAPTPGTMLRDWANAAMDGGSHYPLWSAPLLRVAGRRLSWRR